MKGLTHSDRAMAAALAELEGTAPQTSALLIFLAAARRLKDVCGSDQAAAIAYKVADEYAAPKP